MNEKEFHGKVITVCSFVKKGEREEGKIEYTNLYVKNLPEGFSEEKVKEVFAKFGNISSAKYEEDKNMAYVNFENHANAKQAEEELNEQVLPNGKEGLLVCRHLNKHELEEESNKNKISKLHDLTSQLANCNLYIKPLTADITEERVKREFSKYGTVKSIKLDNRNDRYFGYVMYEDSISAQKAMIETNGQHVFGKPLQVEFYETPVTRQNNKEQEQKEKYEQDFKNLFRMMQGRSNYQRGGGRGGPRPRGGYSQRGGGDRGGGERGGDRGGYQQRGGYQ
jgi:polyadenylate-binding protein